MPENVTNQPGYEEIRAVAIDLDGVVYTGNDPVPGAAEAIQAFRQMGLAIVFPTNSSTKRPQSIAAKLARMGIHTGPGEVMTSGNLAALHVAARIGAAAPVLVLGTGELKEECAAAGLDITGGENAKALIVGLNPSFTYDDVTKGMRAALGGAYFVACNMDRNYPVENGALAPGCGPGVMAISHASGRPPDAVIGKPNTLFIDIICEKLGVAPAGLLVIGDTWETDIQMALKAGCPAIFVGPGNAPSGAGMEVPRLKSISDVPPLLLGN